MHIQDCEANKNGWNNLPTGISKRSKHTTQQFSIPVKDRQSVLIKITDKTRSNKAENCGNLKFCDISKSLSKRENVAISVYGKKSKN
jgi:hypothetical protein